MKFYKSLMDCCGILGIEGVSVCTTLDAFWDHVVETVVRTRVPYTKNEQNRHRCVRHVKEYEPDGAFVQINTSSEQLSTERTLRAIGFIDSGSNASSITGNTITVWLMKSSYFWREYKTYASKKTNYELFPDLFPEEAPSDVKMMPKIPKLKTTPRDNSLFIGFDPFEMA